MADKKLEPIINDSQKEQLAETIPQSVTPPVHPAGIEKTMAKGCIGPHDLFTLFTASIIRQKVPFTR